MVKTIHCPICGGKYFLFGDKEGHASEEPVTCPDCGAVAELSKLREHESSNDAKGIEA